MLTLNIKRVDPYYGFVLNGKNDLSIYEKLHQKGYQCLTPYVNSKKSIKVKCPYGHEWSGYSRKVIIPCNNCKICWNLRDLEPAERIAEIITCKEGTTLFQYVKSNVKMQIRCMFGHIFNMIPDDIMSGKWCNICAGNNVDESREKFYSIVASNGGRALTPYINTITKVDIICKQNHTFSPVASSVNMGHWCPHCAGNTVEQGENRFRQTITKKGGIIISPYINRYTKITIQCPNNHIFQSRPGCINQGQWCSKCANKCPEQAQSRFITTVQDRGGVVLGQYVRVHDKVQIQCNRRHIFNMTPGNISKGKWCSKCQNHCPIQARERFEEAVRSKNGTIISEYINTYTKVSMRCQHGHIFGIKPNNVTNSGRWCRECGLGASRGECLVREALKSMNIEFIQEATFDWMPRKRYDFCFLYKERYYIIEYDGIQHFEFVEFFHGDEETFNRKQAIDVNKTIAALNQGFFFIRIAHTDEGDISDIIDWIINDPEPQARLIFSDNSMYEWLLQSIRDKISN